MKHCGGCDTDKPLTEFYIHKTGPRIGKPFSYCKICSNKASSVYRKSNPERIKKRNRDWYHADPEHAKRIARNSTYRRGSKPMSENKLCASYLGITIAETVLAHEFPGFVRMPNNNPDYDYDCPKGFKIDVKSSCRRHYRNWSDRWSFNVRKNKVPHFYLCIAWKDRKSLVPEHLWLIPGWLVNEKSTFSITDSSKSLIKWSKYERSLKNVLECCNRLVSNETLWNRYQETQSFDDLTRYLKHAAYLRIVEETKDERRF